MELTRFKVYIILIFGGRRFEYKLFDRCCANSVKVSIQEYNVDIYRTAKELKLCDNMLTMCYKSCLKNL